MKLLPRLNLPIRVRPKTVSRQPMPCSGNSKLGRPSEHRYSPLKMPSTGCARCPTTGPVHAKAPTRPARAKCAGRDPARAKSPSKGAAGAKCTGTGPAGTRRPSTGPICAKCPGTVVPAKPGFAQLDLAGSDALQAPWFKLRRPGRKDQAASTGGFVERWYYVICLTLGHGRSLMHGVAPQMCGRVARPLLGRGAGGSLPRLPLAAPVATPKSPPNHSNPAPA
jgi:hypothetical protein